MADHGPRPPRRARPLRRRPTGCAEVLRDCARSRTPSQRPSLQRAPAASLADDAAGRRRGPAATSDRAAGCGRCRSSPPATLGAPPAPSEVHAGHRPARPLPPPCLVADVHRPRGDAVPAATTDAARADARRPGCIPAPSPGRRDADLVRAGGGTARRGAGSATPAPGPQQAPPAPRPRRCWPAPTVAYAPYARHRTRRPRSCCCSAPPRSPGSGTARRRLLRGRATW